MQTELNKRIRVRRFNHASTVSRRVLWFVGYMAVETLPLPLKMGPYTWPLIMDEVSKTIFYQLSKSV